MKKLVLAIMLSVSALMAEGLVVGGDLAYGNAEVTASALGISASAKTKSKSITAKAGYQWDTFRLLGTLGVEKYKEDMLVRGEGNAVSIGVEADYIQDYLLLGLTLAKGNKDFNTFNQDFYEYGFKLGGIYPVDNTNFEGGLYYKKRKYDTYDYMGVGIDVKDKVIGLYVGLSFNL